MPLLFDMVSVQCTYMQVYCIDMLTLPYAHIDWIL